MFCFHYIGQITCCKEKFHGYFYYSLHLPNQCWDQRNYKPNFSQKNLDWCKSFTKENHILHKDNVKELNKFVGSDLYGYKITEDMQSVEFSLKSDKKSFTATLKNGKLFINESK